MTVVVTSYRRGALVTPTLTKVPKKGGLECEHNGRTLCSHIMT